MFVCLGHTAAVSPTTRDDRAALLERCEIDPTKSIAEVG
jgi:hypothetical protein